MSVYKCFGYVTVTLLPRDGHQLNEVVSAAAAVCFQRNTPEDRGPGGFLSQGSWLYKSQELTLSFVAADRHGATLEEAEAFLVSWLVRSVPCALVSSVATPGFK